MAGKNRSMILSDKNTPRWMIFTIDIVIVLTAVIIAYLLRFNFNIPAHELKPLPLVLAIMIAVRAISFLLLRTYAGIVRYTSTEDVVRIFLVLLSGSILFSFINLLTHSFGNEKYIIPFSIIAIELLATTLAMVGFRILVKITYLELQNPSRNRSRVAIYGTGQTGMVTKRAFDRDSGAKARVVAFFDPDARRTGKKIEGVTIYPMEELEEVLRDKEIETLIISDPDMPAETRKELIDRAIQAEARVQNVPHMSQWINGELSVKQIRSVRIEDLLGREVIQLDDQELRKDLAGKRILVTGAAGSIGSEIARQLLHFSPGKVILLDIAESALHDLETELLAKKVLQSCEIRLGDIRDRGKMDRVFRELNPDIVFHAAAYKHVPMMESHPAEAVNTNVHGTMICAELALEYNVSKFILISTDKAVNPTSVMGASKRIAEIYVQSLNQEGKTRFISTRFGNVLGSNGSVIPLFRRQIQEGGPVTITHPEVTRFFMTIPEACRLVLEAGHIGEGGEIFLFDMGESVKVLDLARKMIRLSNLTPGKDIQIVFTGLRPGEKLYEELLHDAENSLPTHHPRLMIGRQREPENPEIIQMIRELAALADEPDQDIIVSKMKAIVPEFRSSNSRFEALDN